MNRASVANACALVAAIGLTVLLGRGSAGRPHEGFTPAEARLVGPTSLADSTGHLVPVRRYSRILSTNLVTDHLLLELIEPNRILAFSRNAAERPRDGYRYAGKPAVDGFGPVEAQIALNPDLVLTNSFGTPGRADKLRGAGIEVFDLGELRGVKDLVKVAETLGALLGEPSRGQDFARTFAQRMKHVAAGLAGRPRKTALFLTYIGSQLQGGTVGTALYEVLIAAGLSDVAAAGYRDWPSYAPEQLLALSPDLIITKIGMSAAVCTFPGADRLAACNAPDGIIELSPELIDEPGPSMLEAAETIYRRVYGAQP